MVLRDDQGRACRVLILCVALATAGVAGAQDVTGGGGPSNTPVQVSSENRLLETLNAREGASSPNRGIEREGWSLAASMLVPRSEHAVAELDGKVWVLGGYPPGRIPSDLVQVYDPATNNWKAGPPLPQPLHHIMATSVAGKLYVIGGEFDGAGTGRPSIFVDTVYEHDPEVGGWVAKARMPTARAGGGAAVINGKIYVAGGRPPAGNDFAEYDPATNRWTKLPDLPTQRNHLAVAAMDQKIFVAGGRFGPGFNSERTAVVEIFDPATGTWSLGTPLPAARAGVTSAIVNSCLFVFGGEGEQGDVLGLTPDVYAFDPRANRWSAQPRLPIAIHGLKGSAVIGGRVHLPGGGVAQGGNVGTNVQQVYRPTLSCL